MSALPTTLRPRRAEDRRSAPDLRVVAPPRHTARWMLLLVAAVAAGVFGIVSLSALAAEQAFAARALEAEISDLSHRYEELTAEVAALESPARVRQVAVDELGMVHASRPAFLLVDGSATAVAARSTGAPSALADPLKPALGASP